MKRASRLVCITCSLVLLGAFATVSGARTRAHPKPIKVAVGAVNPCRYVPDRALAAIFHRRTVRKVEGKLGPTCIFSAGRRQLATLAIEVVDVRGQVHGMRRRTRSQIDGRWAYCGRLGSWLMLVPLGRGRATLDIVAPCAEAGRLAHRALASLSA